MERKTLIFFTHHQSGHTCTYKVFFCYFVIIMKMLPVWHNIWETFVTNKSKRYYVFNTWQYSLWALCIQVTRQLLYNISYSKPWQWCKFASLPFVYMLPKPSRGAGFSCLAHQKLVAFPPAPCTALRRAHQISVNMQRNTPIPMYAQKQK